MMIGSISVLQSDGSWIFLEFNRNFKTPLCEFLEIARSFARDYCSAFRVYSCVCVEVGSIKRCFGRYWYTEKGVVASEKILQNLS